VAQASAAAVKVCGLFSKAEMTTSPMITSVNERICSAAANVYRSARIGH
jgi:heterodisulfide reductase subunit A